MVNLETGPWSQAITSPRSPVSDADGYQSPIPLSGGPFRAENGVGCPLTSLFLDRVEVVY
jgi:hypothetical protein